MLQLRSGNLHPSCTTDGGMGDITIPSDLIARVNDHHPFVQVIGQDPGDLTQCCGFTHAGATHQQKRVSTVKQIPHHRHGAEDSTPDATGQAHHITPAIAYRTDPVEGPLDACTVVGSKTPKASHGGVKIVSG
tara:strand:- start:10 stop:408 length:399 start_codon:yes stop_codon:yes gene_type:complete